MRIFLVGYMGSGKTTVGKKLSNKLGIPFYDLDLEIEKKVVQKIPEIFENLGESVFRELEKDQLRQICTADNFILACGGGTPIFHNNMEYMNNMGITIYLEMNTQAVLSRLSNQNNNRPLLKNKSKEELLVFVNSHLNERIPFYEKAKYKVNSIGIDLNEIIHIVEQNKQG